MKQLLLLGVALTFSIIGFSQTDSDLRKLNATRQFLATTDLANLYIDTPPFYPGGGEKWNKYVLASTTMQQAMESARAQNMIPGKYTVIVKFAVNPDSTLSDIQTINKPLGYGLEEAAIQLIKGSGKWIPANISGANTRSYLKLPVNITIHTPRSQH